MKKISFIIVAVFLFSGCSQKFPTSIDNIEAGLKSCDEEQAKINMPTFPRCSAKVFKNNGWSKEDAKKYLKEKRNIDIDKFISENNQFWKEAWDAY
jgi:PBP1b-binding outer membrane lipoprotein LpoB